MSNNTRLTLCEARGPLNDLMEKLSGENGAEWLRDLNKLLRRESFALPAASSSSDLSTEWNAFYQKFFASTFDLSAVCVPEYKKGFDRTLVIPKGLTLNQVWSACKEHFACYSYYGDDLDKVVVKNDRKPVDGTYAILVRDRVEADSELKNKSADDLAGRSIQGITLIERLILELKYFSETGKHLDIENVTLCSGSRDADGRIPRVAWNEGRLCVSWYDPSCAYPGLRTRAVVS